MVLLVVQILALQDAGAAGTVGCPYALTTNADAAVKSKKNCFMLKRFYMKEIRDYKPFKDMEN